MSCFLRRRMNSNVLGKTSPLNNPAGSVAVFSKRSTVGILSADDRDVIPENIDARRMMGITAATRAEGIKLGSLQDLAELKKNSIEFWRRLHGRTKMVMLLSIRNVLKPTGTGKGKGKVAESAEHDIPPIDDFTLEEIMIYIYKKQKLLELPIERPIKETIATRFPKFLKGSSVINDYIAASEKIAEELAAEMRDTDGET